MLPLNEKTIHTVFIAFAAFGAALSAVFAILLYYRTKKTEKWGEEEAQPAQDILSVRDYKASKPLVPSLVTEFGAGVGMFVFGLIGLFLTHELFPGPRLFASFCLAVACEAAASMSVYVYRLRFDRMIIFVPKAVGLVGKVLKDIPAGKMGLGSIRLYMNHQIVTISSRSVDEVILTKGTDVRVVYADSDRVAVVERHLPKRDEPFLS
ncbi:MAG: hypothetical protein LBC69_03055 [Eubacteriaceae bacterium]|nr:hypothetical protein [Eubacteriaceae bacterium]